ncbi:peptidase [Sphingopyxis sp. J-6]|uniref:peptidase n=1 Tax=Sphingopyxis sp. J-6 TaxID=3122054 RepID=UPI003983F305
MIKSLRRPLSIVLGALATTTLGGCYYGDVGTSYASAGNLCADSYYDYDPYAYDDGYGYDCYDSSDYGSGFVNIGFGGGWYDDYYYPGYGTWMYDSYRHRYPLRGQYLNYWGGRRAWWRHHGGRPGNGHWNGPGRPGHGDGDGRPGRPGRPGGWTPGDRDNDGHHGTRPGRPGAGNPGGPPTTTNPVRPGRPGRPDGVRPRPPGSVDATPGRPGRPGRPDGVRPSWPGRGNGDGVRPGRPGGQPGGAATAPRPPAQARPAPAQRPAPAARPAPQPRADPPARGPGDRVNRTRPQ